jgi:hypothetical protein
MQPFSPGRRRAHRAEAFIRAYQFPRSVLDAVARAHPELDAERLATVEQGLREWLICCAHREGAQLGMPSRAVDRAWHEFILHTTAYHEFCRRAYGEYLHHVPEADMAVPMRSGLWATVRAWDRSEGGQAGREPSLWELDDRLGLEDSEGVSPQDRQYARHPLRARGRAALWLGGADGNYAALPFAGGHGGHDGGGGCGGGGGGCGGGGG